MTSHGGCCSKIQISLPLRFRRELSLNNFRGLTFTFISVSDFEELRLLVNSALGQHFRRNVHSYLRKDLHISVLFIF